MLSENKMYIGIIDKFENYDEGSIIFHIPNLVEKGLAYSLVSEKKPNIGDEVMLFKMNSQLNSSWFYLNIVQTGEFIMEYNGSNIIFKDGKVFIQSSEINFNYEVIDRDTKQGNESIVYGSNLEIWLNRLISMLMTEFKVITPTGPSATATPDALAKLVQLKAQIPNLVSTYIKSVREESKSKINF